MTLFQGLSGAAILFLIGFWAGRAIRRIRRFNNGGALRAEPDAEDERVTEIDPFWLMAGELSTMNFSNQHPEVALEWLKSRLASYAALKQERDSLAAELAEARPLLEEARDWDGSSENEGVVLGAALEYQDAQAAKKEGK